MNGFGAPFENNNNYGYINGWSQSGFFTPMFHWMPLHVEETDRERHFPGGGYSLICCSKKGLLLLFKPQDSSYCICNPIINGSNKVIAPPPLRSHNGSRPIPRALVVQFDQNVLVFHIVCALRMDGPNHSYYNFDVFSSVTNTWSSSAWQIPKEIIHNTGVTCGTTVYWLLSGQQKLIYYDVSNNTCHSRTLPVSPTRCASQLGIAMGDLHLASLTTEGTIIISRMEEVWITVTSVAPFDIWPWPQISRFDSEKCEILFCLAHYGVSVLEAPWWYGQWIFNCTYLDSTHVPCQLGDLIPITLSDSINPALHS